MRTLEAAWLAAGLLVLSADCLASPPPASAFAALPEMSMVRLSPSSPAKTTGSRRAAPA